MYQLSSQCIFSLLILCDANNYHMINKVVNIDPPSCIPFEILNNGNLSVCLVDGLSADSMILLLPS